MTTNNEFLGRRIAKGSFTITQTAATHSLGAIIPAGAIITGVNILAPSAVTTTAAAATVRLRIGTNNAVSAIAISALPAVSAVTSLTLQTAAGVYVPASGDLNVIQQASSTSAATGTYNVYVDYIYVP